MFKIHNHIGTEQYFIIPPNELFSKNHSHVVEAALLGMDVLEYYSFLKRTYRSVRLRVYKNFISFSLSKAAATNLMLKLNKAYRLVK